MTDAATRFESGPSAMAPVPYLVRDRVVEPTVAVDVGRRDPPAHARLAEAKLDRDVAKSPGGVANEERVDRVAAQVVAGSEMRPRPVHDVG